jgi:hypothetical protein
MRKTIPLAALLLIGCMNNGTIRRKPGSDVILPASPNLLAGLVVGALCLSVPTPGVATTVVTATPTATPVNPTGTATGTVGTTTGGTTGVAGACAASARHDGGADARSPARPPQR